MSFVALITGASSGIGEATARLLAERRPDAQIILVARRQERVDALAAELNLGGQHAAGRAHPYAADLTDAHAVAGLADYVSQRFGQLNLLVNNAGARWSQPFAQGGYANVAQTMAINFDAQVRLTELMLPLLRQAASAPPEAGATQAASVSPSEAGAAQAASAPPAEAPQPQAGAAGQLASSTTDTPRAAIVNVASTAGRVGRPGAAAYSASKAALGAWSDGIYGELAPEGIHVGLVNPGFVSTEGFPQTELASHPLKRHLLGTREQVAAAILRAGLEHKAEVFVPGYYWVPAALRALAPGLIRRATAGGTFTTGTTLDAATRDTP